MLLMDIFVEQKSIHLVTNMLTQQCAILFFQRVLHLSDRCFPLHCVCSFGYEQSYQHLIVINT